MIRLTGRAQGVGRDHSIDVQPTTFERLHLRLHPRSVDDARRDGVDANAAWAKFIRECARQRDDRCLGGAVRRDVGPAAQCSDRCHINDACAAHHALGCFPRRAVLRAHVHVEHGVDELVGRFGHRTGGGENAGVVDEDVQRAVVTARGLNGAGELPRVSNVASGEGGADFPGSVVGGGVEIGDRHQRSSLNEACRDRPPDPLASARHQGSTTREVNEIRERLLVDHARHATESAGPVFPTAPRW